MVDPVTNEQLKLSFIIHTQKWKTCNCYYIMESSGMAMIRITQEDKKYFTLSDLYVDESGRKRGVGTQLVNKAISYCKKLTKHGHIQLATNDNSEDFCDEWYQRLGFKFAGMEASLSLEDKDKELEWDKLYNLEF